MSMVSSCMAAKCVGRQPAGKCLQERYKLGSHKLEERKNIAWVVRTSSTVYRKAVREQLKVSKASAVVATINS